MSFFTFSSYILPSSKFYYTWESKSWLPKVTLFEPFLDLFCWLLLERMVWGWEGGGILDALSKLLMINCYPCYFYFYTSLSWRSSSNIESGAWLLWWSDLKTSGEETAENCPWLVKSEVCYKLMDAAESALKSKMFSICRSVSTKAAGVCSSGSILISFDLFRTFETSSQPGPAFSSKSSPESRQANTWRLGPTRWAGLCTTTYYNGLFWLI